MAEKLMMIALSPTMEAGHIAKWRVKEGDTISNGDIVCDVETDKATMEYETMMDGTILKIVAGEGSDSKVGETIAIVGEAGEDIAEILKEVEAEKNAAPSAPTKASSTPSAAPVAASAAPAPTATPATSSASGRVKASPLARKMAKERGLDLSQISGSGPGGRIVKRDIESAPAQRAAFTRENVSLPISKKRRVIAQRLSESKYSAPHYYLKVSIQMDGVLAARSALNKTRKDGKISLNAFIIKLVAEALKRHPVVNSSWQGDHILQFGSVDVGLAVAQDDGLITPVVRGCGDQGIVSIDEQLKDLIQRARSNGLHPEEFTGATFTISSLGSFGIEEFTAIINPPGSAILALGEVKKQPVINDDDEIEIQSLMKVTMSCDHRVIDGAVGAEFLKTLKEIFENPISALY